MAVIFVLPDCHPWFGTFEQNLQPLMQTMSHALQQREQALCLVPLQLPYRHLEQEEQMHEQVWPAATKCDIYLHPLRLTSNCLNLVHIVLFYEFVQFRVEFVQHLEQARVTDKDV